MNTENTLLFHPLITTWHELAKIRNMRCGSNVDFWAKREIFWLLDGLKNRLTEVAFVVATVFVFFYSLLSYPIRSYWYEENQLTGIELDLKRLSAEEKRQAEAMIHSYFGKHKDKFEFLSAEKKHEIIRKVVSQCARSQKVYGPIVKHWVDHLLQKAAGEGKKLVFMARDGIPFYRVAVELMKTPEYRNKYPQLTQEGAIVLGWFSRNLIDHAGESKDNQDIFKRYLSEELKIQSGDRCLFVDIGFAGSRIQDIRDLLPGVEIEFHFLVATSDKAQGFLGNPKHPLPHLESAGNNLGASWAEESHHGTVASSTKLIVGKDGRVYPDTLYPKKVLSEERFSLQHLMRKFCLKGLVRYATSLPRLSQEEAQKAREVFSQTIGSIKNLELPIFLGWEY